MSLSVIKDLMTIIASSVAVYVALRGLHTWRRQLLGQSQYDLSRRLLAKTLKVRDSIQAVRNPMMHLSVNAGDKASQLESEKAEYSRRLAELDKSWSELRVESLEAEVLWGKQISDVLKPLTHCRAELISNIWLHFWMEGAYALPSTTVDNSPERVAKNDGVIYFTSEDSEADEFSGQLKKAVNSIEDYLRPKLKI